MTMIREDDPLAKLTGKPGFAPPRVEKKLSKRRAVELLASVALTISLVVAATAVSIANRSLARGDHGERPVRISLPQQ